VTSIEARVVLGLPPGFTGDELKRAYRRAASENHPDRGGSTEQMVLVNQAHALLSTHQPIEAETSPCEPGAWTVADIVAVIGAIAAAMFADNVTDFFGALVIGPAVFYLLSSTLMVRRTGTV
jgi:hypothetical protein